jgi:CheY-like chemotaxis protein
VRVLVAEDNAINQLVVRRMLRQLGCEPVIVGDGADAVAAIGAAPFDLVLMDLHMPALGGLDAVRLLRTQWPAGTGPRIVALSADVSGSIREQCRAAGMDAFLSKPVSKDALRRLLDDVGRREP